jgi:hypothetical protein
VRLFLTKRKQAPGRCDPPKKVNPVSSDTQPPPAEYTRPRLDYSTVKNEETAAAWLRDNGYIIRGNAIKRYKRPLVWYHAGRLYRDCNGRGGLPVASTTAAAWLQAAASEIYFFMNKSSRER